MKFQYNPERQIMAISFRPPERFTAAFIKSQRAKVLGSLAVGGIYVESISDDDVYTYSERGATQQQTASIDNIIEFMQLIEVAYAVTLTTYEVNR